MSTAGKSPASAAASRKADSPAPSSVAGDDPSKAIERLETKIKAVNANNIARVANSQLSSTDDKLHPMLSLKTGKPIEKFPATPKDIDKYLPNLDTMLHALEADRTGNEAAKRQRLRVQLGLRATPA